MPCSQSAAAEGSVLLVQLTDSHLFAEADGRLLGLETRDSLRRVIERVRQEQPRIDLVLATGDLSQDGSVESYRVLQRMLGSLGAPMRWTAGNHDEVQVMRQVCAAGPYLEPVYDVGAWRVILLDSAVPGAVFGHFADEQLELLERALAAAPQRPTLVVFHHHPVAIGCAWMNTIGLRNAAELFAVTDRHPQVRALLWGHVHQEFERLRNGVRLLSSPSTCVQFAPGSEDFLVGAEAPGYRWLRLHADGRFDTGVSRVEGIEFEIDYGVTGY